MNIKLRVTENRWNVSEATVCLEQTGNLVFFQPFADTLEDQTIILLPEQVLQLEEVLKKLKEIKK